MAGLLPLFGAAAAPMIASMEGRACAVEDDTTVAEVAEDEDSEEESWSLIARSRASEKGFHACFNFV